MKFLKGVVIAAFLLSSRSAADLLDPSWIFYDSTVVYGDFRYCDTTRKVDVLCHAWKSDELPDTGDSYNGTTYIDFNYQFNINPIPIKNTFDTTQIDTTFLPRPGYAGFKTAWDLGMTGFPLPRYKYLIFAHHGPLLNHKVTVRSWYNDGNCGSKSYQDYIGTFAASASWKLDTIVIPDSIRSRSDLAKNYKYYELVFIINNADPNDTNKTSAPGFLRIDNMKLAGLDLPVTPTTPPATKKSGCGGGFAIAFIPPIWFKARAMLRRKKRNGRLS